MLEMVRNIILFIGWPVLIGGSIYLSVVGKRVYALVKGSMVGGVSKALIITMLVEMYSLGIVSTLLMFAEVGWTYVVIPVFLLWFVTFIWSIQVLMKAEAETRKLTEGTPAA